MADLKSNNLEVVEQELDQNPLKILKQGSEMIKMIFKKDEQYREKL